MTKAELLNLHPTRKHRITFQSDETGSSAAFRFTTIEWLSYALGEKLWAVAQSALFDWCIVDVFVRLGSDDETTESKRVSFQWRDDAWRAVPVPFVDQPVVEFVADWLRADVFDEMDVYTTGDER